MNSYNMNMYDIKDIDENENQIRNMRTTLSVRVQAEFTLLLLFEESYPR